MYQLAHRSLHDIFRLTSHVDAVHGLYYVVMHFFFQIWDGGLAALRLPSVIAYVVAACFVAAIGRRFGGARLGLLCGIAYVLTPAVQKYAQEGRSYALVSAFVATATYCFLRALSTDRPPWWIAYVATSVVACWLNEFAAFAIVSYAVAVPVRRYRERVGRHFVAASVAIFLCVIPLAVVSDSQVHRQLGWLGSPDRIDWIIYFAITVWCLITLVATRRGAKPVNLMRLASALWVVPGGALLLATVTITPLFVDRYVVYSYIGFALALGGAIDSFTDSVASHPSFTRRARVIAAAVAIAAVVAVIVPWSLLTRSPESRLDDVKAIVAASTDLGEPGAAVVFMPARRREWILSFPTVIRRFKDIALDQRPAESATLEGTELPADEIAQRIKAQTRIVVLTDPGVTHPTRIRRNRPSGRLSNAISNRARNEHPEAPGSSCMCEKAIVCTPAAEPLVGAGREVSCNLHRSRRCVRPPRSRTGGFRQPASGPACSPRIVRPAPHPRSSAGAGGLSAEIILSCCRRRAPPAGTLDIAASRQHHTELCIRSHSGSVSVTHAVVCCPSLIRCLS